MNKWLSNSTLLADICGRVGVKKEFEDFIIEAFYSYQHLSAPWHDDRGVNYDVLSFGIKIPF